MLYSKGESGYLAVVTRPIGRRNADHESTRAQLVARAGAALLAAPGTGLSFRQLAEAAGVGPTTLRHYFPSRTELICAVLDGWHKQGQPFLKEAANRSEGGLHRSLHWLLRFMVEGWRAGVGTMHCKALGIGLEDRQLGPAYLEALLEPLLQAAEARLASHVADGQLGPCNARFAAIELVTPVFMALLHQEGLGGASCRPLDLDAFVDEHLRRFLMAHRQPDKGGQGNQPT